ncbi:hypothetical protein BGZ47_009766 [Haplosporangium gracile]|nr:hypothetical protein BGZ47_009766 [Haplosporangium gracile]
MDEVIKMYEDYLKNKYPNKERIEFDVNEVLDMVFNLPDCAALVRATRTKPRYFDTPTLDAQNLQDHPPCHQIQPNFKFNFDSKNNKMTRASKSYRSTTPKEPRETKAEKAKRLENYRVAKAQAKKFVIPGIIAVIAFLFFLFVSMYGLKGAKMDGTVAHGRSASDILFEEAHRDFANHFGGKVDPEKATREELKTQVFETLKQGDAKWNREHLESATQDYEPAAKEQVIME